MPCDFIQTQRAYLSWQIPLGTNGERTRYAVGELETQADGNIAFRYLHGTEDFNNAKSVGFNGYLGLPLSADAYPDALSILRRRLPPASRLDFSDFLESFGLPRGGNYTDLSILAYTGARLTSDSFGISETFDGFDRPFSYIFDIAGFRHYQNKLNLNKNNEGAQIIFEHDVNNTHDSNAVRLITKNKAPVGYINRLYSKKIAHWLNSVSIEGKIYKVNGRTAYPRLYVQAKIDPRANAERAA